MIPTAEVRWFVEGALPEAARRWFQALAPDAAAEAPRTDRYAPTEAEDLGVKVRQGKLEAKGRTEALGLERWGRAGGHVETWRKWSYVLAADARPTGWIPVEKKRWLARYRIEGSAVERAAGEIPQGGEGVNVELTAVKAGSRMWWSVCLESSGPDEAARLGALRRVAAHVFDGGAPTGLAARASMGYPAWLRKAGLSESAG